MPILLPGARAPPGSMPDVQDSDVSDERAITVLFADLRGFTRLAESRLPYDVVFVLNRYFASMGAAEVSLDWQSMRCLKV